ncbi:MAG: hypothetical protein AAGF76_17115 [Pseudomonadota bacterium]
MFSRLDRFGLPLKYGVAGIVGGVISVLIGPLLGLDDGPDAWLTPILTGAIGYGAGVWLARQARKEQGDRSDGE